MPRCAFAEWRGPLPASNYRAGPTAKIGVVHHVIVGSLSSADSEFHGNGAMLSAHFGVADGTDVYPDGHLVQWVDTDDVSYAQVAGNVAYVSVETAGYPDKPWTAAQVATLAALDQWLAATHHFPLVLVDHGQPGLTTHCHYPSGQPDPAWGDHVCPGPVRLAQMAAVLAATEPSEEALMQVTVAPNGTLYVAAADPNSHLLVFSAANVNGPWAVEDVTAKIQQEVPGSQPYLVKG